jgi:hypothetical protein
MSLQPMPPHGGLFREFGDVPEEIAHEEDAARGPHDGHAEEQAKKRRRTTRLSRWLGFLRRR